MLLTRHSLKWGLVTKGWRKYTSTRKRGLVRKYGISIKVYEASQGILKSMRQIINHFSFLSSEANMHQALSSLYRFLHRLVLHRWVQPGLLPPMECSR
uniref:Uncharacterized protein n=1 Tax=Picea glauca TaxID=3330 RepID=A0A101M1X9_PICGL|nr:hypothetical protein ABT39_MTgene3957 [Picea glauca]QHR91070.1 hypothetical protein Q903MT_gene5102 [Picea sitchensis]